MKETPYSILGVDKTASPDDIKKAYRKRAKKTHSDAGGDNEDFIKVGKAYKLLMDPERRSHYNETGEDGGVVTAEVIQQQVVQMVMALILKFPDGHDIMALAVKNIKDQQAELFNNVRQIRKTAERVVRLAKRIKSKDDKNIFIEAAQQQAEQMEQVAKGDEIKIQYADKMLDVLKDYKWDAEAASFFFPRCSKVSFGGMVFDVRTPNG